MAVTARLHPQPGTRIRGEIGGHDRCGAAEEGKWVGLHSGVALGEQFRDSLSALRDENIDRIDAVWGRRPLRVRVERHLASPLDADIAPLIEAPVVR